MGDSKSLFLIGSSSSSDDLKATPLERLESFMDEKIKEKVNSIRESKGEPDSPKSMDDEGSEESSVTKLTDSDSESVDTKYPVPSKVCGNCSEKNSMELACCQKCGDYLPGPNETFDLSKKKFTLPTAMFETQPYRHRPESEFETPFPLAPGDPSITTSREADEWILNHLPLTEDQKQFIIDDILKEKGELKKREIADDRQLKVKQAQEEALRKAKFIRRDIYKASDSTNRLSVKRRS